MINQALINPGSIAILGASNNLEKPGGRLVENLCSGGFKGSIYLVNPKEDEISGQKVFHDIRELPQTDLAILAIPAHACVEAVEIMASTKSTKAIIIVSAGFSESKGEGINYEEQLKVLAKKFSISIIGPNCIGIVNKNYPAIFVSPVPQVVNGGVDFVSASGAFAVFLFETAARQGLKFGSIFSVGNSATIGVEEVLAYWDETYRRDISSGIKLIYIEQIRNPVLFFKHASSLFTKGCHLVMIKPGESEAAARAALSHTGALAGDNKALGLLIEKTGAFRCYSREEMVYMACILQQTELKGRNIAVITDAGGPGVMLVDRLNKAGLVVPELDKEIQQKLLLKLFPGASAGNPIDMLATCNREQLSFVLQVCDGLPYIDGMVVIYGKTGMEDLNETYKVLSNTIRSCNKPVFTIAPSINTAVGEISEYTKLGNTVFFDEVVFAGILGKIVNKTKVCGNKLYSAPPIDSKKENSIQILSENQVIERLNILGLPMVKSFLLSKEEDIPVIDTLRFPVAAKVMGILHKTEVSGVMLNLQNSFDLLQAYRQLSSIKGSKGVMVQEMVKGTELFLGGKMHPGVGYSIHIGLGGIFIELIGDIASSLAPLSVKEAKELLISLKANKLFQGYRNLPPIEIEPLSQLVSKFSQIFNQYPDIYEIDINPLIAYGADFLVVDARILVYS